MTFINGPEELSNHETVATTPPLNILAANPANLDRTLGVPCRDADGGALPFWAGRSGQSQPKETVRKVSYGQRQEGNTVSPYVEFQDTSGRNIQLGYDPKTPKDGIGGNGYNVANAQLVAGLALYRIFGGERDKPPLHIQVAQRLLDMHHEDLALSQSLGLQISGGDVPLRQNNIVIPIEPDGSKSDEFQPVLLSEQVAYPRQQFQLAKGPLYIGGLDQSGYQQVLPMLSNHDGTTIWSPNSFDFQSILKGELAQETVVNVLSNMDIVTMNAAEALELGIFLGISEPNLVSLARQYCNSFGINNIIITADENPVVFASLSGQVETFQPYAGNQLDCLACVWGDGCGVVRNATGAGDNFAGGVMTGCDFGLSMEQAIKLGLINAGAVFCSRNSNLIRVDMDRYTDQVKKELI